MEINFWRSAITVLSFVLFIGIVWWTYLRSHAAAFEAAAQLPFMDEEPSA